ncbi:MAG: hypothetical protein KKG67_20390 [Gammaproteobacteria bacterium]|nr:hypothetical protein [Gammaproteobacteria bacterium]
MATSNIREVKIAIQAEGEGLVRALVDELARLAQEAVRFMRQKAPKWRSTLTNSIHAEQVSDVEWLVRPGVDYAQAVEEGSKPGKGLPRWSDPAAADIKAWLTTKAFAGRRRARKNSMKAVHENLELRDRYQGLAWHVRHFGVKASPFVGPTAEMMRVQFPNRMALAARRYLATQGGGDPA